MKARFFASELAYLREQGREFAKRHPRMAPLLAGETDDADVERLLEGFAFLAAAIRERADDAVPELAGSFSSVLVPHLTRFIPPTTIVQFRPQTHGLKGLETVPRGAVLSGRVGGGPVCQFRTTAPATLVPARLLRTEYRSLGEARDELRLHLTSSEHVLKELAGHRLQLFLDGALSMWTTLRAWFVRHCVMAELVVDGKSLRMDANAVRALGFDDEASLLPGRPLEHDAFTRVAEFFSYPEKFAFVELPPLPRPTAAKFELRFVFSGGPRPPKTPGEGDIRLHCVPAVNLFETTADPIRYDPLRPWSIVRTAGYAPVDAEVWEVRDVQVLGGTTRRRLVPFHSFAGGRGEAREFFHTRAETSTLDSGTDVYLALGTARDGVLPPNQAVLSLKLLSSNRASACQLPLGGVNETTRATMVATRFSNVKPVSPPLYPHDKPELVWRLGAHLGLSRKALHDASTLKALLAVYNFAAVGNPSLAELNQRWIDSILDVKVETRVRVRRGAPMSGTRTTVVLDGNLFSSLGEATILGDFLDDVIGRRVSINSFNELCVQVAPSGDVQLWLPRNGTMTLS